MEKQDNNISYSPTIYTRENIKLLKELKVLDDGQIYIYVMLNSLGNVKIGKTINIQQRLLSLSGSNGGGAKISSLYCSPSTWVQTMEETCHNHYHFARIKGTEWFDGKKVDFKEVVEYVDGLFRSKGYETCNELRRKLAIKGKNNDNKGN
jgi:hypothetical protein